MSRGDHERRLLALELAVIAPTVAGGAVLVIGHPGDFHFGLLLWAAAVAIVELIPVPAWRGIHLSIGFPLLMALAFYEMPVAAGVVAFLGSVDPREFRGGVTLLRAVFNRAQVALSVFAASSVFHAFVPAFVDDALPAWWVLVGAAMVASVADYIINSAMVTLFTSIRVGLPPREVLKELRIGRSIEFFVSYLGLGVLGLIMAMFVVKVGAWSLPAFLAPLLFARQMFFRSQALVEAHKELKEREQVLKVLSNAMAEERADERLQIAGYLHDDLAQVLFRLSIQVDVARKLLEKGQVVDVAAQLDKIRESKQETSDRIRALIRDLHRSPLGAKGLAEALESFTDEQGRDSSVRFHRDVADIDLPAPIALLVFHIAREGVMNSLKHAQARDMWISVGEEANDIVLTLRDNGVGFDTSAPGPEGHFGMAMMRQRAANGGGRFEVASAPGEGTTITVRFPIDLLGQEPAPTSPGQPGPPTGRSDGPAAGASRGTPGTTEQEVEGSRRSVPA
jgi:signal transduction histidine kinase